MKIKAVLLVIVVLLTLTYCGKEEETQGKEEETQKVLLFVRDGSMDLDFMLKEEAGVMKDLLEQSGFEVAVATVSGEPMEAGSSSLKADLKLSDVSVADYAGFILPCMAVDDTTYQIPEEAVAMVKKAAAEGKPVAAQLGSVLTLAEAGILIGKKYAFYEEAGISDPHMIPSLKGSVFSGTGIVQDGNIITSGICPYMARWRGREDGTKELTSALIDAVKANTD